MDNFRQREYAMSYACKFEKYFVLNLDLYFIAMFHALKLSVRLQLWTFAKSWYKKIVSNIREEFANHGGLHGISWLILSNIQYLSERNQETSYLVDW
jgi:hypothetical protein